VLSVDEVAEVPRQQDLAEPIIVEFSIIVKLQVP
jgi:hypothetical protein